MLPLLFPSWLDKAPYNLLQPEQGVRKNVNEATYI